MKIDENKNLIVDIKAEIVWIAPATTAQEQIIRNTANHKVRAMGNRLEHSVETIIKAMLE